MQRLGRVFAAVWGGATWRAYGYLLAGLPLGVLWFSWAVTIYVTGAALVIIWVGIPLLVLAQVSMRWIGAFERRHANRMLEARISEPEPAKPRPGAERADTPWKRVFHWGGSALHDAHAWRVLAWTMVRGVLGPVGFVVAVVALTVPIAVLGTAVTYTVLDNQAGGFDWAQTEQWTSEPEWYGDWVYWLYPIGAMLAVGGAWLARGFALLHVPIARWSLGPCSAEREQALAERAELAEEQLRIDQELHDSIGHMITMTIVQAGAGAHVFDSDPAFARQALKNIEERGRSAMGELDRIIAAIRGDEPETRAPLPGIADLPALIASSQAAGIAVVGSLSAPEVPPAFGRAAYGIVREALTNAARHAPGGPVEVVVTQDGDALAIDVTNGPAESAGSAPGRTGGTGRGLTGIRDRVGLLGGRSSIGPTADGGFRVAVLLPLETSLSPEADDASRWAHVRATVGA